MDINSNKDLMDTVQVALRIRPLVESEQQRGCVDCIEVVRGVPQVQIRDLAFTYNYVFPPHVGQQEFYDTAVKNLIGKLFEGYNLTILAYGQTGSGKTYSMGTNYDGNEYDMTNLGVIPQAVKDIFDYVDHHSNEYIFKVSVAFMELYQEQCYDLLSSRTRNHSTIEIREDLSGIILPGLTEVEVSSSKDTMMCLVKGSAGRAVGATAMNSMSSRSHAIFTIFIYKESRSDKNDAIKSKFHLVDLAGSERSKKTQATGDRFKEGVKINQGLLALGNVISALGDGANRGFITYRESKLTRLLQDSLGGNSVTLMIACVSPADYNLDETVSTLRYADRARKIKNKPVINQDAKSAEIARLNKLLNEARMQLSGNLPVASTEELAALQDKYDHLLKENIMYAEKNKNLTNIINGLLQEQTKMCEKGLLVDQAKEEFYNKISEMAETCNVTLEKVEASSMDCGDNTDSKNCIRDCVLGLKNHIDDMRNVLKKCDNEVLRHDLNDPSDMSRETDTQSETSVEDEQHAMKSMKLNTELQALNHALAVKAELVRQIQINTVELAVMDKNLREDEMKVVALENERDMLVRQTSAKSKTKDPVSDERMKRVADLELEISNLKKKCQQQASVIKMKEKNDQKITALTEEIRNMKATKVQLIKRMRSDNENFRRWRQENERNMTRLKAEDSKRKFAMQKMEAMHAKQQNVFKRKMEHAVAVNKQLKEALDRKKAVQAKRSKTNNKVETVTNWVDQELEMMISTVHAEKTLEDLMEDRSIVTAQLERLRTEGGDPDRMAELKDDLALRNAQISDLQQKILAADQEKSAKSRWGNISTMQEAKCALKHLFDSLVDTKKNEQWLKWEKAEPVKQIQEELELAKTQCEKLDRKLKENKVEMALLEKNFEEKVSHLLGVQCDNEGLDRKTAQFAQLQRENIELKAKLDELKKIAQSNTMLPPPPQIPVRKKTPKKRIVYEEIVDFSDEDDSDDDNPNDPEFRLTPLLKRTRSKRTSRPTMNFTVDTMSNHSKTSSSNEDMSGDVSVSQKRSADGLLKCRCKGECAKKTCGCYKNELKCSALCRCMVELCTNRKRDDDENTENTEITQCNENLREENDKNETIPATPQSNNTFINLLAVESRKKKRYFLEKINDSDSPVIGGGNNIMNTTVTLE